MKDLKTGKTFVAFNTHLDHVSKDARRNGMKLILERMARYAQGRPVFLTGDMNATLKSVPSTWRSGRRTSIAPAERSDAAGGPTQSPPPTCGKL